MAKILYRVGEGANLEALPRGTKVGDEIRLTEAEALYERDMGRLIDVEAEKAGADETKALAAAAKEAATAVPGETQSHSVDAVSSGVLPEVIPLDGRAAPAEDPDPKVDECSGAEMISVAGPDLAVDEAVASKSRRR